MRSKFKLLGGALSALPFLVIFFMAGCASTATQMGGKQSDIGTNTKAPTHASQGSQTPVPGNIEGMHSGLSCEQLLSLQDLYSYNPNFALDQEAEVPDPEISAKVEYLSGFTCPYVNLTSGEVIQISIAKVTETSALVLRNQIAKSSGDSRPTGNQIQTQFEIDSLGIGKEQVLKDNFWIWAISPVFATSSDTTALLEPLLSKL